VTAGLLPLEERRVDDVLGGIGAYTLCANDPPWSAIAPRVRAPARVVHAWNMDEGHLATLLDGEPDTAVVVGLGGGTAMDTAKYLAWRTGKRLVQIPSITSVDAAFTDAIGVRVERKVKYVGRIVPERVVLDVDLVRRAPKRLNRSGVGDVLSPWDEAAAALGRALLDELEDALDDVREVSVDGVRFLASAYRRIGAECARLRHSRFEEGSEHFLGYSYEHATGAHPMHGELVAMCVVAMSALQDNDPDRAREVVARSGVAAHPLDVGMTGGEFAAALRELPEFVRRERLDFSVVDVVKIDEATVDRLWRIVNALPRARRSEGT
jgi:glycerol dehydrogenase-like iron-containing ADH family enzyme